MEQHRPRRLFAIFDILQALTALVLRKLRLEWREDGCYPGCPVFVPSALPDANDTSGIIISVVLDFRNDTSFLLMLDAASMQELARATLPHAVPFPLHGDFSPEPLI